MKWRPVIIMALVALSIWQAFEFGFDAGQAKAENAALSAAKNEYDRVLQEKKKLDDQLSDIDARYAAEMKVMQGKIDDAKKQAAQYKPQQDTDCDCSRLDNDWVRIHDAAASVSGAGYTDPARVDDGKAGAVENHSGTASKQQAIETITDNYAACAVYINQVNGLQDFVRTLTEKPN